MSDTITNLILLASAVVCILALFPAEWIVKVDASLRAAFNKLIRKD